MKLDDQLVSLELSRKLKELRIEQKSIFVWEYFDEKCYGVKFIPYAVVPNEFNNMRIYSAFSVAELGEILPRSIFVTTDDEEKKIFSNFRLVIGRNIIVIEEKPVETWLINYVCDSTNEFRNWLFDTLLTKSIYDNNEANARAKMLIHLIENKLVSVEDVDAK